jgi:hypothetical protein|tara:strand:+ start:1393 stop:1914 length:522 start_codon:yes stop_codon:yes gene_type:complete
MGFLTNNERYGFYNQAGAATGTGAATGVAGPTGAVPSCTSVNNDCNCYYAGCTDITSPNYMASATCDDGSCTAGVLGCMTPGLLGYNPLANMDDGSCGATAVSGCTDIAAANHNPAANTGCNWQSGPAVPSPAQTAPTQGTQSSFSGYANAAGSYANFNQQGFGGYNDRRVAW